MPSVYDIAVLGATAAGYAAAYSLARSKLRVVLIEAPPRCAESPLADWVEPAFFRIPGLPKSLVRKCKATPFRRVRYHNLQMDRTAEAKFRAAAGYFLKSADLRKALKAAAVEAGAKIKSSRTEPTIRLHEDYVEITGPARTRADFLLIAHSRPSDVLAELSLPVRSVPGACLTVAGLDVPLPRRGRVADLEGALHVVETAEQGELGMVFLVGSLVHIRIISSSAASGTRVAELSAMVGALQRAQVLPENLPLGRARGAVWRPPAGVALELETHVAKRCLLTGTGGGFADSIVGQTLTPSVKSSLLAAEVVLAARNSKDPQEALMTYKSCWRKSLSEYLCPPNTSLHLLLPLLFVSKNIVPGFTRALLYGQSI